MGFLSAQTEDAPTMVASVGGLREGLVELGYVEGHNLVLEVRFANGDSGKLAEFATELANSATDIIVLNGALAAAAAQRVTSSVPVVFFSIADPIGSGLVTSLAHPGGNLTGMSSSSSLVQPKRLDLLRQMVPGLYRIAVIANGANSGNRSQLAELQVAADAIGVQMSTLDVRTEDDVEGVFATAVSWSAQGLMVLADGGPVSNGVPRIIDLAALQQLPTMYAFGEYVKVGGFAAYGASPRGQGLGAATYIDRIAKGAKPADLPVQQPTVFEFVLNLNTAQALGLTIPPDVAAQVTEWVK